jgi:hypothetical protein
MEDATFVTPGPRRGTAFATTFVGHGVLTGRPAVPAATGEADEVLAPVG